MQNKTIRHFLLVAIPLLALLIFYQWRSRRANALPTRGEAATFQQIEDADKNQGLLPEDDDEAIIDDLEEVQDWYEDLEALANLPRASATPFWKHFLTFLAGGCIVFFVGAFYQGWFPSLSLWLNGGVDNTGEDDDTKEKQHQNQNEIDNEFDTIKVEDEEKELEEALKRADPDIAKVHQHLRLIYLFYKWKEAKEPSEEPKQAFEKSLKKVRFLGTRVSLPALEGIITEREQQQLAAAIAMINLLNEFEKEYQADLKDNSYQAFYPETYTEHRQTQKETIKAFFTAVNEMFQQGLQRKDVTLIGKGLQVTAVDGLWQAAEAYIGTQPNMQSHADMVQALNEQMQKVAGAVCPDDAPDSSIIFKYLYGKERKATFKARCQRYQRDLTFLKGAEQIGFPTITKLSASCIKALTGNIDAAIKGLMQKQKEEPPEQKENIDEKQEEDPKNEEKYTVPDEAQKETWSNEELQRFDRAKQAFTLMKDHLRALNLTSTKAKWDSYMKEKGLEEKVKTYIASLNIDTDPPPQPIPSSLLPLFVEKKPTITAKNIQDPFIKEIATRLSEAFKMPDAIGEHKVCYILMAYCDLLQYYRDNEEVSEYISLSDGRTLNPQNLEEVIGAIFDNLDKNSWLGRQGERFFVQGAQWAETDPRARKLVKDFSASQTLVKFKRAFADKFFFTETIRLSKIPFTNPTQSSERDRVIVIVGNKDVKRAEIIRYLAGRKEEKKAASQEGKERVMVSIPMDVPEQDNNTTHKVILTYPPTFKDTLANNIRLVHALEAYKKVQVVFYLADNQAASILKTLLRRLSVSAAQPPKLDEFLKRLKHFVNQSKEGVACLFNLEGGNSEKVKLAINNILSANAGNNDAEQKDAADIPQDKAIKTSEPIWNKLLQNSFVDGSKAGFRPFITGAVQGEVYNKVLGHLDNITNYAKGDYNLAIYKLQVLQTFIDFLREEKVQKELINAIKKEYEKAKNKIKTDWMYALQQIRIEQKSEDGMQGGTQDKYNLFCEAYANHQSFFTDHLYPERYSDRDEEVVTSFKVENEFRRKEKEEIKQENIQDKSPRNLKNQADSNNKSGCILM